MIVRVNVTDALASPKSEILGIYVSVNKIFALEERGGENQKREFSKPVDIFICYSCNKNVRGNFVGNCSISKLIALL